MRSYGTPCTYLLWYGFTILSFLPSAFFCVHETSRRVWTIPTTILDSNVRNPRRRWFYGLMAVRYRSRSFYIVEPTVILDDPFLSIIFFYNLAWKLEKGSFFFFSSSKVRLIFGNNFGRNVDGLVKLWLLRTRGTRFLVCSCKCLSSVRAARSPAFTLEWLVNHSTETRVRAGEADKEKPRKKEEGKTDA